MVLDKIFAGTVSITLLCFIVLRLSGVIRNVEKALGLTVLFILVGGWLVDIIKLIQQPPPRTDLTDLWSLVIETIAIVLLAYQEIRTRRLRRPTTTG
jgi:hypothetical protein